MQHLGYVLEASGLRVYVTGDLINTFGNHDVLLKPVADLKPEIAFLTMHPTEGEFPYFDGAVKDRHQAQPEGRRTRALCMLCKAHVRSVPLCGDATGGWAKGSHHPL